MKHTWPWSLIQTDRQSYLLRLNHKAVPPTPHTCQACGILDLPLCRSRVEHTIQQTTGKNLQIGGSSHPQLRFH
ncbi:MAG: hypothetical protein KatS3mg029_0760 [Saprospiraceae bacterium]|nr:MAG: hypothetical protein KatS3mg029_0760 [Saprospiraceae bacterium]